MRNIPKYFVCSNGDAPECLKFSEEEAKKTGLPYIDAFNEQGEKVIVFECIGSKITDGVENYIYEVTLRNDLK